jgi:hypothetical protein
MDYKYLTLIILLDTNNLMNSDTRIVFQNNRNNNFNGWPIINGPLLHATFQLLHISSYKNKIHQKMQHEKLYNLHRTGNFMVTIFVFKSDKIVSDQISTLRKRCFF